MLLRLSAVIALVTVLAGGTWYFFRDTPAKRMGRWRVLVQEYLEAGDLEEAERWQNEILKYNGANYDRMVRALIGVRKGTVDGYEDALEMYDLVLDSGDPNALVAGLHKAKVLGFLGRYAEANSLCLSVMDKHPVEATTLLGDTALATLNPDVAITHFERALEFVDQDQPIERARVLHRLSDAYLLILRANPETADLHDDQANDESSEASKAAARKKNTEAELERRARAVIEQAIALIESSDPIVSENLAGDVTLLSRLYLKLGDVRREGTTPCYQGTVRIAEFRRRAKSQPGGDPMQLLVRLGTLNLRALHEEREHLADKSETGLERLRANARGHFLGALKDLSVAQGEELLAEASSSSNGDKKALASSRDSEPARRYARALAGIANAYLDAGLGEAIFDDSASRIDLATRIEKATEVDADDVRHLFSMITGFAALTTGKTDHARRTFEAYLAEIPEKQRASTLLSIVARCQDMAPTAELSLDLYANVEKYESSPFLRLGDRLKFLLRARAQPNVTKKASALLSKSLENVRSAADSLDEYNVVGHVTSLVEGPAEAIEWLEAAAEKVSNDKRIRRELITQRGRLAGALAQSGKKEEAAKYFRDALAGILDFYVTAPAGDDGIQSALLGIIQALDFLEVDPIAPDVLSRTYPNTDTETRRKIAEATEALFRKDGKKIFATLEGTIPSDETAPYIAFLRGKAHILTSTRETLDKAIENAEAEHRTHPDYSGNAVELLSLAVGKSAPDQDVSNQLIDRIEDYIEKDPTEFVGRWLLVEALRRRIPAQYQQPDVKNSDVARHVSKLQNVLRKIIRTKPSFTPAHLALAVTFSYGELDKFVEKKRELFDDDYDRAVAILRSVPRPTHASLLALADTLQRSAKSRQLDDKPEERLAKFREATRHFELLCLLEPSLDNFRFLTGSYIQTGDFDSALRVLAETSEKSSQPNEVATNFAKNLETLLASRSMVTGVRIAFFRSLLKSTRSEETAQDQYRGLQLALNRRLGSIPNSKGLRHLLLATVYGARQAGAAPRYVTKFHQSMISHYEKSVQAFDDVGATPPILVLNNLAWVLVESKDRTRRERGLELARRAADLVPNLAQAPDVHDTLAWALYRNEQHTEAENQLRALLDDVDSPTYRFHLATVLHAQERHDEALEAVRAALDSPRKFDEEKEARRLESKIRTARSKRRTPRAVGADRR